MNDYTIRLAYESELSKIPLIELAAADRFRETHYAYLAVDTEASVDEAYCHQQFAQGLLWVAADEMDQPVGFVVAEVLDDALFIHELDVLPDHGRRGLGRRLIAAVCERARTVGYAAVTLSTFADIPWNAPFYIRVGFCELADAELTPGLRAVQQAEAEGLPNTNRVIMRMELKGIYDRTNIPIPRSNR